MYNYLHYISSLYTCQSYYLITTKYNISPLLSIACIGLLFSAPSFSGLQCKNGILSIDKQTFKLVKIVKILQFGSDHGQNWNFIGFVEFKCQLNDRRSPIAPLLSQSHILPSCLHSVIRPASWKSARWSLIDAALKRKPILSSGRKQNDNDDESFFISFYQWLIYLRISNIVFGREISSKYECILQSHIKDL